MEPGRGFECKWDEGEKRHLHNLPSTTNIFRVINQEGREGSACSKHEGEGNSWKLNGRKKGNDPVRDLVARRRSYRNSNVNLGEGIWTRFN
jgi:hypothetical protein